MRWGSGWQPAARSGSRPARWRAALTSDLAILLWLALGRILLHTLTNGGYGFHRDELAMLDDARHLAWGYVAYPPLTPFVTRIAYMLFGPSLAGLRLPSVLAQAAMMVLVGLMARELGGRASNSSAARSPAGSETATAFRTRRPPPTRRFWSAAACASPGRSSGPRYATSDDREAGIRGFGEGIPLRIVSTTDQYRNLGGMD